MTLEVAINLQAHSWEHLPDLETLTEKVVTTALAKSGAALADYCEVCVTFCDDAWIKDLNAQWRGKDAPTNVLSFPTPGALDDKPMLGDIVIAYETTSREAREGEKRLQNHVSHLIVHGFLHLIGYDHRTKADAEVMEAMERRIMESLGIDDPYDGTEPADDASAAR